MDYLCTKHLLCALSSFPKFPKPPFKAAIFILFYSCYQCLERKFPQIAHQYVQGLEFEHRLAKIQTPHSSHSLRVRVSMEDYHFPVLSPATASSHSESQLWFPEIIILTLFFLNDSSTSFSSKDADTEERLL